MSWTWTGNGSTNNWTDSENWVKSPGYPGTPSSYGDGTVYIDGPATIDLDGNQKITSLHINCGNVLITGADTLSLNKSLQLTAGSALSFGAGTKIGGSATLSISGFGTATISGGIFTNDQNTVLIGSGQNLVLAGGTSLTVANIDNGIGHFAAGTLTLNGASLNLACGSSGAAICFDQVISGGVNNILRVPSYAEGMTLQNLGYGDEIYAGGDTLELRDNCNGTYSLIDIHNGRYDSIVAPCVTLAPGTNPNDFSMRDNYFVYTGPAPCFYAGTLIATPAGPVAVEHIQAGDPVLTADGRVLPVRWVGCSQVSTRFADPLRALPIRIKAGALAEGVPARDLLVSPDHALFLGGILVQAGALVNDASIIREADVPEIFTYYHVELATHELLLADGAPAESFVDNVDRMHFSNWAGREAPREAIEEMVYPRAKSARQVPAALRQSLGARAARLAMPRAA